MRTHYQRHFRAISRAHDWRNRLRRKGAVDALTITLAAEVAELGITVNAVDPGPSDTGWMTPEIRQQLLPRFPLGRIGQPEDAARLVAFLASDEAQWITGQIIHSTGGFLHA